jgi:hypothetical protein
MKPGKRKNVNSARPIPAHGLDLPGAVVCVARQATTPSWPVCRCLAPRRRRPVRPMPAAPDGAHRPRAPRAVRRPWRGRRWCLDQQGVAGAAVRAPGR